MCKKIMYLFSFIIVLGLVSGARGDVIDSFENGPGAWEIMDPPETLAQSTEGVTDGTSSLQRNFTAGFHFIDLDVSGLVDVLNANDTLEIDVTTSLTAEQVGWYLQQSIILQGGNAAGSYYLEGPLVDVASPDGTPTTTTVAFDYAPALTDGPLTDWAKIRLVTNTGGDGVLYYDNLRAVSSAPPPATVVIGDFEGNLDGWWAGDATLSFSTTGATLSTQALQVDGPGGWHQNALLDLKPHREALASSGATITADVTAFDADMTTTWMQVEMVINAQSNDDSGANNNVGWQSLGSQDVIRDGQPHTLTWVIPDSLRPVIAGVDDSISWFQLVLVTNLDAASVTKFYIDNIQLSYEAPAASPGKSTDVIIGNWEQDMDGWVAGGGADVLFNDHNGVTLGDYSLDIFIPNGGGWNDQVLQLDVMAVGLLDAFKANSKVSLDVTRLVADWPKDVIPQWNEIDLVIQTGGDGWDASWIQLPMQAGWDQNTGDQTVTATWDYRTRMSDMNYLEGVTWFTLLIVSNVDDQYTGWSLFYLDNMKLSGAGVPLDPQPASGASDVPIDTTLSWTAGPFAATHHLYLGTDWAKVNDADMDSDPDVTFVAPDANSFDPNGLEFKTQYFWRVVEVNEANPDGPWTGPVWDFTTADFLIIDDFESYNDINPGEPGSNRILDTWSDGFTDETNGALVGNDFPPYAEQTTVRNGAQSMPIYYDNTGAALQSETQRVWAEPQAWMTSAGSNTLKLYTYGAAQNVPGELYVIIEDSTGVSLKLMNPDSTIFTAEEWMEWEISLNEFTAAGVNLAAVKKLVIGIADIAGQAEANGKLYIDDIRRRPPVVVSLDPDHVVVPKTTVAPIIDGVWDGVWNDVNETQCLITEMSNTDSATPEDSNDLSATFKAFYDDNNFYIFVEVQDSLIDYEFSDYQGDGVEIYFDGDYSHGDSYDGVNDNQIRITVDDVELADIDSSLPVDGTVFKVLLTDSGYNIEASFPLEVLQIYPSEDPEPLLDADGVEIPGSGIAPNNIIGFEVQINDNDSAGGRQTIMRWHSDDNGSWGNSSLFGQARLVSTTIGN